MCKSEMLKLAQVQDLCLFTLCGMRLAGDEPTLTHGKWLMVADQSRA